VQILVAGIRNEYKEQKIHLYHPVCFCYARKPEDPNVDGEMGKASSAEATTGADKTNDALLFRE